MLTLLIKSKKVFIQYFEMILRFYQPTLTYILTDKKTRNIYPSGEGFLGVTQKKKPFKKYFEADIKMF